MKVCHRDTVTVRWGVNPGRGPPRPQPWTSETRHLCNCVRGPEACPEQLFREAGLKIIPELLLSQQLPKTHPGQICHTRSKSGTSWKMDPGVHYKLPWGPGSLLWGRAARPGLRPTAPPKARPSLPCIPVHPQASVGRRGLAG